MLTYYPQLQNQKKFTFSLCGYLSFESTLKHMTIYLPHERFVLIKELDEYRIKLQK